MHISRCEHRSLNTHANWDILLFSRCHCSVNRHKRLLIPHTKLFAIKHKRHYSVDWGNKNPTSTRDELVTYDVESIYIEHPFKRICVSLHTRLPMSMLLVLNYADSNLFFYVKDTANNWILCTYGRMFKKTQHLFVIPIC